MEGIFACVYKDPGDHFSLCLLLELVQVRSHSEAACHWARACGKYTWPSVIPSSLYLNFIVITAGRQIQQPRLGNAKLLLKVLWCAEGNLSTVSSASQSRPPSLHPFPASRLSGGACSLPGMHEWVWWATARLPVWEVHPTHRTSVVPLWELTFMHRVTYSWWWQESQ